MASRDTLRVLLVDNYDSYTYNLCHRLLCAHPGVAEVEVVRNDAIAWADLLTRLDHFDAVVISPGPGVPSNPSDFGLCADILRWATAHKETAGAAAPPMPVLGVCLGHQGLAWVLGGRVVRAPRVAHGVVEPIVHYGAGLFDGLPDTTSVVRYHSWVVDEDTLPSCLAVTAWTRQGAAPMPEAVQNKDTAGEAQLPQGSRLIMAIAHRTLPVFGVQFHPESVCTRDGDAMLANFARTAHTVGRRRRCVGHGHDYVPIGRVFTRAVGLIDAPKPRDGMDAAVPREPIFPKRALWRRLPDGCFPDDLPTAFCALVGDAPRRFWLDSSRSDSPDDGRFSYMGTCAARGLAAVTCDLAAGQITEWHASTSGLHSTTLTIAADGFMGHLGRILAARRCASDPALPCGLCGGGLVGYLGYEMRRECGSGDVPKAAAAVPGARPGEPDAAFLVVDRYVVLDHVDRAVYAVALIDADHRGPCRHDKSNIDDGDDDPETWFGHVQDIFRATKRTEIRVGSPASKEATFALDRGATPTPPTLRRAWARLPTARVVMNCA